METTLKLVMTFENEDGAKVSLTLNDPKGSISESEIADAMNLVVEKAIFSPNGLELVAPIGAKIVQTETTEFDLV